MKRIALCCLLSVLWGPAAQLICRAAVDSFEPDDSAPQASRIWNGPAQTHSIDPIGDEDWLHFVLPTTCGVTIATSGPIGDTRMWLYDSDLFEIEYNDDADYPSNRFSRIHRRCGTNPLPPGGYYVKIDDYFDDDVIETYQVEIHIVACQTRELYVDDDATADPGPGDPTISDPLEDGTPAHPFDAIAEAIEVAVDGDTVMVMEGTYTGPGNYDLDFSAGLGWGTRNLTVRGDGRAEDTIIDCQGEPYGFVFTNGETNTAVVEGLTVRGAAAAGIRVDSTAPTLVDCVLTANSGPGLKIDYGTPRVTGCTITFNFSIGFGAGIYCYGGAAVIEDCLIAWNQGGSYGTGVFFEDCWSGDPVLRRSTVYGNTGTDYGGGIGCMWSDPLIENCVIARNISYTRGGGLYAEINSNPTLVNCTVVGNVAVGDGGGMYVTGGSQLLARNCIVWHNTPTPVAIDPADPGDVTFDFSTIEGGWAGPGMRNLDADPRLLYFDSRLANAMTCWYLASGSPCIDAGSDLYAPAIDRRGRPRYDDPTTPNTGPNELHTSDIGAYEYKAWFVDAARGNNAHGGLHRLPAEAATGPKRDIQSALDVAAAGDQVIVGPGTYRGPRNRNLNLYNQDLVLRSERGPTTTVIDCEASASNPHRAISFNPDQTGEAVLSGFRIINGNVAQGQSGGAIYIAYADPTVLNCVIEDCEGAYGGAILVFRGSPTIADCIFRRNAARMTTPNSGDGGAIKVYYGEAVIQNCLLVHNTAERNGGGIDAGQSETRIESCTLYGNTAASSGGGVYIEGDTYMLHGIAWSNTPQSVHVWSGNPTVLFCNVEGGSSQPWFDASCLDVVPVFVPGPLHDYYLSHTDLQGTNCPCVDAGASAATDSWFAGLTTRTDGMADGGLLDLGFHAPHQLWMTDITLENGSPAVRWNARSGEAYTIGWTHDGLHWNTEYVGMRESWTDEAGVTAPGATLCVWEE